MRTRWLVLILVLVITGAGIGGWWATYRPHVPASKEPPTPAIADPVVAAAANKARDEVLAHPTDANAWGRLGLTLLANGVLKPARECFAEAGRLNPADPNWPYLEGVSLLVIDPESAVPCWQRAAECPGTDERAVVARLRWAETLLANERLAEAEDVLNRLPLPGSHAIRLHFNLGWLSEARGNAKAAIEQFRQCTEDPASRRKAYTHLATLYSQIGKQAEAGEAVQQTARLPNDSTWPDPYRESYLTYTIGSESLFLQAELQQQQGNYREAIQLYEQFIESNSTDGRTYARLGMLLAERGEYEAAEKVLRQGIAVAPELIQTHYFLTVSLFHQAERRGFQTPIGKEKLAAAASEAKRTLALKADHGFAHLYRGLVLKSQGQPDQALAEFQEAVRCAPDAVDPHLHLGQALAEANRRDEAVKELEAAIRVAPPSDTRPRTALEKLKGKEQGSGGTR